MPPRVRLVLIVLAACILAGIAGTWVAAYQAADDPEGGWAGALRPPGAAVPPFSLRDQDGRRITDATLRDRGPVVFTFVYSTCEDTCPVIVQQIRGALDDLDRDVTVVGISVDPARDNAERARRFVADQHMTDRMGFLLGSRAQLQPVWKAFGIAPQTEHLEHSAHVVVVDGTGRQRVGFPADKLTRDGLAADLRRLGA